MAQYTDAEMLLAAQISYMDIPPGENVAKAIEAALNTYKDCDLGSQGWWQYQWALSAQRIINDNNLTSYQHWTIKDVCNNEDSSGFYGCLIDDGRGNAIIGCRGSEQYDTGQLEKDWKEADFGLLNSTLTDQQADATDYMQYLYDKYGDKYGSFSITGHSLGGNLAEHSAVTAPEGMNIDHVINYDGPGFSDEYIAAHQDEIARVCDKIDHYQHSIVGSFLNSLPGVDRQVINARNDPRVSGISSTLGHLLRHDASNIIMDNGYVQPGTADFLQSTIGPLSRLIDNYGWGTLPFLYFFGPAMLVNAIKNQVADNLNQIVNNARSVFDTIGNFLGDLYNKYFGHEVSGEFEVNIASLQAFPDELGSIASRSEDIADEIRSIVSSLKYHSVSGAYYKNKLRRIARNIEKAGRYARNSGNVLFDVLYLYGTKDTEVAESYT